jgi:hypothetical protein
VTAPLINFGNINSYFTSFITQSISIIGNGSTSVNVSFNGSNNTFNSNGTFTSSTFISTDNYGLLFNSPNSTFIVTSSDITVGTIFGIDNVFNAPNSSFYITNLNSSYNPCLFTCDVSATINVSGSTFIITGTTSSSLIQVYGTFIGRNCVFDCSQMTSATFATITAGTMDITNSIVDLTADTSLAYNYINNSSKLIAPACTFINATGPGGATGPFIYNQANATANLLNCNFRTKNPNIINTGTNSITDISPLVLQRNLSSTSGTASFGLTYSDTNLSVSICPYSGTTPTTAPYITGITASGISYTVGPAGYYTITVTKSQSSIF